MFSATKDTQKDSRLTSVKWWMHFIWKYFWQCYNTCQNSEMNWFVFVDQANNSGVKQINKPGPWGPEEAGSQKLVWRRCCNVLQCVARVARLWQRCSPGLQVSLVQTGEVCWVCCQGPQEQLLVWGQEVVQLGPRRLGLLLGRGTFSVDSVHLCSKKKREITMNRQKYKAWFWKKKVKK